MFQRLLICTDFADGLDRLVHFVDGLVAAGITHITFLHAVAYEGAGVPREDVEAVTQAKERLAPALNKVPGNAEVQVEVESCIRPSEAIVRFAQQRQIDLILLGRPTVDLISEKLFGSTTVAVCQKTSTPIMVLRPQLVSTYTIEELDLRCRHLFRYLLIPYNGTDASKALIQQIKQRIQNQPGSTLEQCHLCWVVETTRRRDLPNDYQIAAVRKELAEVRADLEASTKLKIDPLDVREGDDVLEVLEAARMADVSAIIVSAGEARRRIPFSESQFASELLRRSWHPIIYLPNAQ